MVMDTAVRETGQVCNTVQQGGTVAAMALNRHAVHRQPDTAGVATTVEIDLPRSSKIVRVVAFDGKDLGRLVHIDDERIAVHGRRADFWLPRILVRDVADAVVTLHVDGAKVQQYQAQAGSTSGPRLAIRAVSHAALSLVMGAALLFTR